MLDVPLKSLDLGVPAWIDQDLTTADVAAIVEGGCASGAYMPAVTYATARATMAEHGDEVIQFIDDHIGELPAPPIGSSWSGISVHYLSLAVELWVSGAAAEIEEIKKGEDEE